MPEGGQITVKSRVAENNSQIRVSVSDTGIGIPADQVHLVGRPFYTTKPNLTREGASNPSGFCLSCIYRGADL
jgi:signal transduction histidine kinase